MLLPMEGDQWILLIAGINGETPPTEPQAMPSATPLRLTGHRGHRSRTSEPIGEPVTHRFPANQRRHIESLRRFPLGWVLLGDAVCSFNPIYGQGMTSAAQQAGALGRLPRPRWRGEPILRPAYFRAASRIVDTPWSIAVGGDFAYAGTTGKKPFGTDLLNHYMDRVIKAGQCDDDVVIRLNEVIALVRSPQSLMSPVFVLRVLREARHADRLAAAHHATDSASSGGGLSVTARA